MTVLATAQWGGVALFLVPLPIAIVVLILGARRERADTFLLLMLSITLLPAFWATALRAGLGPCNGCLHGTEKNLMLLAFPTLPLLVGAIVLLFLGRMQLGAIVIVVAQVLLAVAVWKTDAAMSWFMALLIAGEVLYVVLTGRAARNVDAISAGNGHPGGARQLTRET